MGWGAESIAFAVTGALFLLCGAIASSSIVGARRRTLVSLLVAALIFITAAFRSRWYAEWSSAPWTWGFALLPLALIGFFGTHAAMTLAETHSILRCLAPRREIRRRAAVASDVAASMRMHSAADPASSGTELADLAYAHPELRTTIAANPATPANVLGWLASTGGADIAAAIVGRSSENDVTEATRGPAGAGGLGA